MYRNSIYVVLLGALHSAVSGQARLAIPPSEANFFIGTPAGCVHPKTPWGDPDLQGICALNYVDSTPLQRCNPRPVAAPAPSDSVQLLRTEEEVHALQANAAT